MKHPIFMALLSLYTFFTIQADELPYPNSTSRKISELGYPAIDRQVLEQGELRKPNWVPETVMARSQKWTLASIGFFNVFNPILQPVKTTTAPCSKSVVVAVIDTGIDYNHPDLRDSIWINSLESGPWTPSLGNTTSCQNLNCNGIDDDNNGYVDDSIGWDFVHNIPTPFDVLGHGTHITGIISAQGTQYGVCQGGSVMTLKYYDPSNSGAINLSNLVQAIRYANQNGADIINFSGGGVDPSQLELAELTKSRNLGVLVITAAGNQGRSNDLIGSYPANYHLDNIVSVASVDSKNQLLSSSNYGERVHLAAPGDDIASTLPLGGTGRLTGTSQATAFVTGAATLLISQIQNHAPNEYSKIKSWLTRSAKKVNFNRAGATVGAGLLSIGGALALLQKEEPTASK